MTQIAAGLKAQTGAFWNRLGTRFLPFADAATDELPLGAHPAAVAVPGLGRHGGGAADGHAQPRDDRRTPHVGEPGRGDGLVAAAVRAAARADRVQVRSSPSLLGWKRVPYIWFGTLLQFGGLAILPFALLVMTGGRHRARVRRAARRGGGFLLVGAGMHTTQTAGLALATDLAPRACAAAGRRAALRHAAGRHDGQRDRDRPAARAISPRPSWSRSSRARRALTMVLNVIALWKQEARNRAAHRPHARRPARRSARSGRIFIARPATMRLLVAVGLGAAAFSMQDVLARTLWRPDPRPVGRIDDLADRALGGRDARRFRAMPRSS